MPFDPGKLAKFQASMHRRIDSLRAKAEGSLDFAVDYMMLDRVDTFFKVEEGFDEIARSLSLIGEELPHICDLSGAIRLESRLEFLEDRFEELDSEVRERPRRRRRGINMASFFRAAAGDGGSNSSPRGEINTTHEALSALGLEQGSPMSAVTKAFRQRAKKLHPDVREGDRTSEPELRRIIEAYQYLKETISFSSTEPPPER